jgi:hypothetical protein
MNITTYDLNRLIFISFQKLSTLWTDIILKHYLKKNMLEVKLE